MRKNRFRGKSFLIQSRRERDTYRVDVAVSVLFRTLWSLHDVVHVRNPHFIRRVWRQNSEEEAWCHFSAHVYFEKYSYKRNFHVLAGFFFRESRGGGETNRTESKLPVFLFKNLILLNLPSLTKRSLGRGRWRRCARTNGKRGRCRIRCRREGKRSRRRRRRWWLRSRWFFTHQRRCRWSW